MTENEVFLTQNTFPIIKSDPTLNVLTSSLPTLVLVPKITFTWDPLRHLPQYHVKDQKSC